MTTRIHGKCHRPFGLGSPRSRCWPISSSESTLPALQTAVFFLLCPYMVGGGSEGGREAARRGRREGGKREGMSRETEQGRERRTETEREREGEVFLNSSGH